MDMGIACLVSDKIYNFSELVWNLKLFLAI